MPSAFGNEPLVVCPSGPDRPETPAQTLSFEQALARWEEVVAALERGALTLEESLQLYEEGRRLREICHARLNEAEGKLKRLQETSEGSLVLQDMEA